MIFFQCQDLKGVRPIIPDIPFTATKEDLEKVCAHSEQSRVLMLYAIKITDDQRDSHSLNFPISPMVKQQSLPERNSVYGTRAEGAGGDAEETVRLEIGISVLFPDAISKTLGFIGVAEG